MRLLPLALARHHGQTLAYSVIAALGTGARPIASSIHAAIGDVELTRNGGKPSHTYPVQVVRLGRQLTLAALQTSVVSQPMTQPPAKRPMPGATSDQFVPAPRRRAGAGSVAAGTPDGTVYTEVGAT